MNTPRKDIQTSTYGHLQDGDALRIPLKDIDPLPGGNIRKRRDPSARNNLRLAIRRAGGVTQSITVRINPDDSCRVQQIAGFGRLECSELEGYPDIPVLFKVANDRQALAMMFSENFDREDLSLADEIVAAQRFVSHYDGDYKLAAEHLNWSVKKLKGRLTLNQCTENVLEALRDKVISLGYAEILSAFTEVIQDGTLEKIIKENWSLEFLKERAGKANRWINHAIFDTADCASCPHNSDIQASLFDNTVGKAKCSNLVCYKEKTEESLLRQKADLEDSHGVVLLAIEKPLSDRNTVNIEAVGEDQFRSGCTGCVSNAVILQDGINRGSGTVKTNQCIDTDCYRKMSVAHSQPPVCSDKLSSTPSKAKSAASKSASSNASQKTPKAVTEKSKALLRSLSANHFSGNEHFKEAIAVASLMDITGLVNEYERWAPYLDGAKRLEPDFNKRVLQLYALSSTMIGQIKQAAYSAFLTEAGDQVSDPEALSILALAASPKGKEIAVSGWLPSKDLLKAYLKPGIVVVATKSGFAKHYDAIHGEQAFNKIAKNTKAVLIETIVRAEFDWSSYSPDDYIKCLG